MQPEDTPYTTCSVWQPQSKPRPGDGQNVDMVMPPPSPLVTREALQAFTQQLVVRFATAPSATPPTPIASHGRKAAPLSTGCGLEASSGEGNAIGPEHRHRIPRHPDTKRLEALRGDRAGKHSIRINDQCRLAKAIDVPASRISEIVAGRRAISADTDLRLLRIELAGMG